MRQLLLCLVILIGVCFRPNFAHAFQPDMSHNHWFLESYDFDPTLLPIGMTLTPEGPLSETLQSYTIATLPDEAVHYVDLKTLQSDVLRANLLALYESGEPVASSQLQRFGKRVGQNHWFDLHRFILGAAERNPQSPGNEAVDLIEPFASEFWFATETALYQVPVTVNYELNPDYDPNTLVYDAPFSDRLLVADYVVIAKAIDPPKLTDEEPFLDSTPFAIEAWLMGSGPAILDIGSFGPDSMGMGPVPTQRLVLLLRERDGSYFIQASRWPEPATIDEVLAFAGQEPFVPEGVLIETPTPVVSVEAVAAGESMAVVSDGVSAEAAPPTPDDAQNSRLSVAAIALAASALATLLLWRRYAGRK